MPVIVGIIYLAFLALVLTYAIGGVGLTLGIFLLLAYMALSELVKAKHEEDEVVRDNHHHPAHGGTH